MRPWQVILRVELPLAAPTIMTGIRTAAINIFATATIASFVGLSTLGDLVTGANVYGDRWRGRGRDRDRGARRPPSSSRSPACNGS